MKELNEATKKTGENAETKLVEPFQELIEKNISRKIIIDL